MLLLIPLLLLLNLLLLLLVMMLLLLLLLLILKLLLFSGFPQNSRLSISLSSTNVRDALQSGQPPQNFWETRKEPQWGHETLRGFIQTSPNPLHRTY